MAIYYDTLEGNMQYGDDPYCFTPIYMDGISLLITKEWLKVSYTSSNATLIYNCCKFEFKGQNYILPMNALL